MIDEVNMKGRFDPDEMREEKYFGNLVKRVDQTSQEKAPTHSLIIEHKKSISQTNKV